MIIALDDEEIKAIRRIYHIANHKHDCPDDCEICPFYFLENPEKVPMFREPRPFCALDVVKALSIRFSKAKKTGINWN